MRKRGRFVAVGFMLLVIIVAVILTACESAPEAKPPAASEVKPPVASEAPQAAVLSPAIGMEIDERYHDIHVNKLELKCEFCHVEATETYSDPLAQASNLADRRACLSCHKEEGAQPFYGEAWGQAKVK